MSRPTLRTSRSKATIWPVAGVDEFARVTYGAPFTVQCTFDIGSKNTYRDSKGVEFVPESVVWYDYAGSFTGNPVNAIPKEDDYIVKGKYTDATPVNGAKPIRAVKVHDCGMLRQNDDIEVAT